MTEKIKIAVVSSISPIHTSNISSPSFIKYSILFIFYHTIVPLSRQIHRSPHISHKGGHGIEYLYTGFEGEHKVELGLKKSRGRRPNGLRPNSYSRKTQHIFAPAGILSSIISRFRRSSPFSVWTAEMSMPLDSSPIIFRGGRLTMATRVLPTSSSGL